MKNLTLEMTKGSIDLRSGETARRHSEESLKCLFELFFKANFFEKYASERNIVVPFSSASGNLEIKAEGFSVVFLDRNLGGREVCSYINSMPYTMIGMTEDDAERAVKLEGLFEKRTEAAILINFSGDEKRHHIKSTFNCYAYHIDLFMDIQPAYRCREDNFHSNPEFKYNNTEFENAGAYESDGRKFLSAVSSAACSCGAKSLLQSFPVESEVGVIPVKKRGGGISALSLLYAADRIKSRRNILECSAEKEKGMLDLRAEYYGASSEADAESAVKDVIEEIEEEYGLEKIEYRCKSEKFK